jgi:hypothetical protein
LAGARRSGEVISLAEVLTAGSSEFYAKGKREHYYAEAWSFLEYLFDTKKLKCDRNSIKTFLTYYYKTWNQEKYPKWEKEWIEWEAAQIKAAGATGPPEKIEVAREKKKDDLKKE